MRPDLTFTAMENVLTRLSETVTSARDLEGLTRPMLELLETVTGMESTYLTTVDENRGIQHILFARNTRDMVIPEGLSVPWGDTLCKRALEENRPYTDDVASCWGDSDAARQLGIKTYLSQPVRNTDGGLYGTLCAASAAKVGVGLGTVKVLGMFAQLIAYQVERERQLEKLQQKNEELAEYALIDPLTRIPNRRALMQELRRMLSRAQREYKTIEVAFIDLDGFKAINDRYGHEAGDRFLAHIANKLSTGLRAGDFVARYGGDEFVAIAPEISEGGFRERLQKLTMGSFSHAGLTIDYGGASVGVVSSIPNETDLEELIGRADAAMYEIKKARRAGLSDQR